MSAQYVAVKKLTGRDLVRVAARHNLREMQAELGARSNIDGGRTRLDQVLVGAATPIEVIHEAGEQCPGFVHAALEAVLRRRVA